MKKADIAINTIFVVLITIISIIMLLGLFSTMFPSFGKAMYCNTFFLIQKQSFMPQAVRADQTYCFTNKTFSKPTMITNETDVNMTLAGNIIACWKYSDYGKYADNMLCYELTLSPIFTQKMHLDEKEITLILAQNDICDILPNDNVDLTPDPKCGTGDKLIWNLGDEIFPHQNILIEYDSTRRAVVIS
jgi:hypothetical protein